MKGDKVLKLDLSDEFLIDSAEKRYQDGDYLGALTMLNKRAERFDSSADACALYADIYEGMELYELAADSWFRFLDTCNEADFPEGYEGLAIAFMNLNNDAQSAYYYRRSLTEEDLDSVFARLDEIDFGAEQKKPELRLIHSIDGTHGNPRALQEGLTLLKEGSVEDAREKFREMPPASADYASAAGLAAMCTLMLGDAEGAEAECRALLESHPDNVQALTTYCAVLGARENRAGAKEVAKKLSTLKVEATDDLYRVATALCETGLDEEAYEKLEILKKRIPNDDNVLYFHAVAAHHIHKTEEAIESLERLTTIFPRKAVARFYLERLRELRDGERNEVAMTYYYRMPEEEYRTVADFLIAASTAPEPELLRELTSLDEFYRLAFDELEGRDEKLQMIAAKVAVRCHADKFLREVLLDYTGDEIIKLSILHDLTVRNEDDSFGVVICNLYKEFFTHLLEFVVRKREAFLKAFADVYSKFALLGEDNEGKICAAAEDVYATLNEMEAWEYMDERASLAAAIYRESRIMHGERSLDEIVKLFDADKIIVERILNYMM